MTNETISGVPRSEQIWLERHAGENVYIITSKENNMDMFFLYRIDNGRAVKLGKSKSPPELERKYIDEADSA